MSPLESAYRFGFFCLFLLLILVSCFSVHTRKLKLPVTGSKPQTSYCGCYHETHFPVDPEMLGLFFQTQKHSEFFMFGLYGGVQFPAVYQQGPQNMFFRWGRILGWMINGVYSSLVVFFLVMGSLGLAAFQKNGQGAGLEEVGAVMYTCIVWVVNVQVAFALSYFTVIQHAVIWGSVALWYLFLVIYGYINPVYSTTAYKVFIETLAPAPMFWLITILVAVACVLPYTVYQAYQRMFHPMDHHVIQEIHYMQKHITDPKMYKREKRKAVQKTKIGFSARVDANLSMQRAKNRYYDPTYTADVKSLRDPPASNVDLFESPLFSSFKRTV